MHPADANFVFASYAANLFSGVNCNSLDIRATTVEEYLAAAQGLLVDGGYKHKAGLPLDKNNSKASDYYIAKVKAFEALPNRRESISDAMLEEIYQRHLQAKPDSLEDCLYDWVGVGRYAAFRSSEWAQSRKLTYELIDEIHWKEARAMIDGDWLFFDESGRLLEKTPHNLSKIFRLDICWRKQKNGRNGEIISFWKDTINPRWCPVLAAWRICMRAQRLKVPAHEPIGRYFDYRRRQVVYINVDEVERALRSVAKAVTGITDDKLINKLFGMHSMRVTACNELARLNVADSFIQRRLRWRSNTFLDYLRNNIYSAQRHNLSLNIKCSPHDTEMQQALFPHTNHGAVVAH
jgi:hypothetical protein